MVFTPMSNLAKVKKQSVASGVNKTITGELHRQLSPVTLLHYAALCTVVHWLGKSHNHE